MVLRCVLSIELVLVEIYGQMGEKPPFLGILGVGTGTILILVNWYRYHIDSGQLVPVPKIRYRYPMLCFGPVLVFWP